MKTQNPKLNMNRTLPFVRYYDTEEERTEGKKERNTEKLEA